MKRNEKRRVNSEHLKPYSIDGDRNKPTKQIRAISIRKMVLVCKWKKEPSS